MKYLSLTIQKLVLTCLMFHFCNVTFAQVSRLYTTQSGLTSSDMYSISIDSKGLIWIAGTSSIDVFDGTNFYNIGKLFNKFEHINAVKRVVEYKDDKYWLATSNGLYLLDGRTCRLDHKMLNEDEDSIMGYSVNHIVDYNRPDLKLISTEGNGLFVFNTETQMVDTTLTRKLRKVAPYPFCSQVFVDEDGYLWGSVFWQVFRIDLTTMAATSFEIAPDAKRILTSSNINHIIQPKKSKNIYFATSSGMLVYDYGQKVLRATANALTNPMPITALFEDQNNRILAGTDNHGLWMMLRDESLMPFINNDPSMNIEYAKVRSFAADKEGNLIVGFAQKGIFVLPHNRNEIGYYSFSPSNNRLNATSITSIAFDGDNYWVGTDGCGVFKMDAQRYRSQTVPFSEGLKSSLVQTIAIDKRNTVWVGSYGGGLQCLQGNKFVTPNWLNLLSSSYVMILQYDAKRDLLFVGTNGQGVFTVDLTNQTITNLFSTMSFNGWIYSLCCDDFGTLWIGTAQGIFAYNIETKKGEEIKFPRSDILMPQCLAVMGRTLLIGTNKGLISYDIKNDEAFEVLSNENVKSIEVAEKDIWLTTSKSVFRIDKQSMKSYEYSSFEGFHIGEFHRNAHYLTDSQDILFGGDNGIVRFNAMMMRVPKTLSHDISFTGVRINGAPINFDERNVHTIMNANFISLTELSLAHNQNSVAVSFGVPEYSEPNQVRFLYFLEGYDQDWQKATNELEANYPNLPPGNYKLRVKAYLENNEQSAIEKTLNIKIHQPWYNTLAAWILYLIVASILGYFGYRIYAERKRQKHLLMEARQEENLKEAKLRMFTSIAHELRSPLTMIVSPLSQLMASTADKGIMAMYNVMKLNCDRLITTVNQITDIRKIDNGQFRLHFSKVNFKDYSKNVFESFSSYASAKNINYQIEHQNPNEELWLDKVHFEKILSNILSNAFKFTPQDGRILVRTRDIMADAAEWLEIRIYNSGSYISEEDLPHVFERFFQANSVENETIGSGIGLNLVNELVHLHHGLISVHNMEPDGVEFVMLFPKHNVHLTADELSPRKDEEDDELQQRLFAEIEENTDEEEDVDDNITKNKKTVLVVDDDQGLCKYVASQISDKYSVIIAHSGNTAWQKILTARPDAVVTDIRMPDGDGIELCKRIKANPETDNLPIVMLTSENSDMAEITSLNLQVDHFISKPFNVLKLKGAIAQGFKVREKMISKMRRNEVDFDYTEQTIDSADDKLFVRINESLKKNLDDSSFGVNELASIVGISRVHLNRKMKDRYGVSPNNFIRSYRLKQAAYLLINNNVNVSEVAYRVGFSSHSHFSNTFREYFGMTPKEFVAYYTEHPDDETLKKLLE